MTIVLTLFPWSEKPFEEKERKRDRKREKIGLNAIVSSPFPSTMSNERNGSCPLTNGSRVPGRRNHHLKCYTLRQKEKEEVVVVVGRERSLFIPLHFDWFPIAFSERLFLEWRRQEKWKASVYSEAEWVSESETETLSKKLNGDRVKMDRETDRPCHSTQCHIESIPFH